VDTVAVARDRALATGADGTVVADGLSPGLHLVRVRNLRVEAEVHAGERAAVRVVTGAGPAIGGRVVTAAGEPVVGIRVDLSGTTAGVRTTGADGSFRFDDVPAGDYRVGVYHPGEGLGDLPVHVRARPGDDALTVRLPAGPAQLRILLEGPPDGSGEFSLLTTSGGAVPTTVGFARLNGSPFETPGFTPGPGVLVVRAQGFGWTAVRFDAPEATTTDVRVVLVPAGTARVRVREDLLGLEEGGQSPMVRLRRADGFPASLVGEERDLLYAFHRSVGAEDAYAYAPTDGAFLLPDLRPGVYEATFGFWQQGRTWVAHARGRVEVTSGATAEVTLTR
jgi:hypothetical protein